MPYSIKICTNSRNYSCIQEIQKIRYKAFYERRKWECLTFQNNQEYDGYDECDPTYLALLYNQSDIVGCIRLLRTTGPYMLRDTFPQLLGGHSPPCSPDIFEASRFAIDTRRTPHVLENGLRRATATLFAATVEWALRNNIKRIVTVVDRPMERLMKRSGWPLIRLSNPSRHDASGAVAGTVEISLNALTAIRMRGGLPRKEILISDENL